MNFQILQNLLGILKNLKAILKIKKKNIVYLH